MMKSGYFAAGDIHWVSIGISMIWIRYFASSLCLIIIHKSYTANSNIDQLLFHYCFNACVMATTQRIDFQFHQPDQPLNSITVHPVHVRSAISANFHSNL